MPRTFLTALLIILQGCLFQSGLNNEESLNTLTGTWKFTEYWDFSESHYPKVMKEPNDIDRSIILTFADSGDTGTIEGQTVTNLISGKYELFENQEMKVLSFGGTKVAEPEWGSKFWDAIQKAIKYHATESELKIWYTDKYRYMRFEKVPDN